MQDFVYEQDLAKKEIKTFERCVEGVQIHVKSKAFISRLRNAWVVLYKNGHSKIRDIVEGYAKSLASDIGDKLAGAQLSDDTIYAAFSRGDYTALYELAKTFHSIKISSDLVVPFAKIKGFDIPDAMSDNIRFAYSILGTEQRNIESARDKIALEARQHLLQTTSEYENRLGSLNDELCIAKSTVSKLQDELSENIKYGENLTEQLDALVEREHTLTSLYYTVFCNIQNRIYAAEERNKQKSNIISECNVTIGRQKEELSAVIAEHEAIVREWEKKYNDVCENCNNLEQQLATLKPQQQGEVNRLYTKQPELALSAAECRDIDSFKLHLKDNLTRVGVKPDVALGLSTYLIATISAGLIPLFIGYKSRKIAEAFSLAYCGDKPYIVALPNGYNNSMEIADIYSNCKFDCLLIEDAVGSMNECALLPLFREKDSFDRKLLLLSTENLENLRYLPMSFYNYISLVYVESISPYKLEPCKSCLSQDALINFVNQTRRNNLDITTYKAVTSKNIKKNKIIVDGAYTTTRAHMLRFCFSITNNEKIGELAYNDFELAALSQLYGED